MATGILGSFAFDGEGRPIEHRLFPKKPGEIAQRLKKARKGEILPEEREIARELIIKGYKELIWDKPGEIRGILCVRKKEHIGEETMQGSYRKLAMDLRWVSSQAELNELLSKVNIELTKTELRKEKRDQLIIRVMSVVDELEKELNVLSEKLREWYGLHFPEADQRIQSHERYTEMVARAGRRHDIEDAELAKLASSSSGMDLSEIDAAELQAFARNLSSLFETRKRLARYLESIARAGMPNTSEVAGPMLASRLLSLAGGLEKMAKLPSSTIQLLGAEKALFRHMKGEGKAPKYGVLFGHPLIQAAPKERKGKVARLVAAKLSLAARTDHYSDKDTGKEMRKDLEEQVARLTRQG